MTRRELLAGAATLGAGALLRQDEEVPRTPVKPKLWVWIGADQKDTFADLAAKGVEGLFLSGATNQEALDAAKDAGLEVHAWMWTTNRGDAWIRENHPDWYMVSRTGKSCFDEPPYVDYYRWVSPVIPGVQSYLKERVDELAAKPEISGVHLDYVRYPDVILPRDLWETYGLDQSEELPDYDFCYSEHTRRAFIEHSGRDPMKIDDPSHDQEWLAFRQDSVTKLVAGLTDTVRERGKAITAAVFPTPSIARKVCRQSWSDWTLDAYCPMVYHSFYKEDVEWIGDCMRENIQATTAPIIPGLYMPALSDLEEFREAVRLVRKRGAEAISMFGGVPDTHWDAL